MHLYIDMTQVKHPRLTRTLPPKPIALEERSRLDEFSDALAARCRVLHKIKPPQSHNL